MDIQKLSIKSLCEPVYLSTKQNIETDIILPDYYDTVGKLIKCSVKPYCENVTVASDKISISGCAEIYLLYLGEDNKLYQYENLYKYTKIIPGENLEVSDCVRIKQDCASLNYHVNGPKRIEIKALLRISAEVIKSKTTDIVNQITNSQLQTKHEALDLAYNNQLVTRDINITNAGNPTAINDSIRFIMRKDCSIEFTELKAISNKLYIKGNALLSIVYLSENDSTVKKTSVTLPISEVVDFYGVEEDSICDICSYDSQVMISVNNKNDENSDIEISIHLIMLISSLVKGELNFISDIYSVENESNTSFDIIEFKTDAEKLTKTISVSFDADAYEGEHFNIADSYIDNITITTENTDNKINCVLNADYNALITSENGAFSLIHRNNTTEFTLESEKRIVNNINYRLLSISALRTAEGKIKFTADIFVSIEIVKLCKVNLLTDVTLLPAVSADTSSEIILYFGQKGETLWDIAKENKTSVTKIKENNSIDCDSLDKDMLLVFPNF